MLVLYLININFARDMQKLQVEIFDKKLIL